MLRAQPSLAPQLDAEQPRSGASQRLRTLVVSHGFGYKRSLVEKWALPLRRHYDGDVMVIMQPSDLKVPELKEMASLHRIKLLASPASVTLNKVVASRWLDLQIVCTDSQYDLCLTADMRDVYWQAPPFAAIEDWYVRRGLRIPDLLLTTEHTGVDMMSCKFSRFRIRECYGEDGLKRTYAAAACTNGSIINAGTVIGSPLAYKTLAAIIPKKSPTCKSGRANSHINDQGILNVLVYTRVLSREHGLAVHVQRNGIGTMLVVSRWGLLEKSLSECKASTTRDEPPPSTCYQPPAAAGDVVLWNFEAGRYACPTVAFPADGGAPKCLGWSTRMPMLVHMYDRLIYDFPISPSTRVALSSLISGNFSVGARWSAAALPRARFSDAAGFAGRLSKGIQTSPGRRTDATKQQRTLPSMPSSLAPARCDSEPRGEASRLLVSMTTVPTRVESVEQVIASLTAQTRVPDHTLIVAPDDMQAWRRMWRSKTNSEAVEAEQREQERSARARLLRLSNHSMVTWGLRLTVTQPKVDHGPIMKLLGALQYMQDHATAEERRTTVIMTIDDDFIYPKWACSNLLRWADRCPSAVMAYAGAHYAGMPQAPEDFKANQKFLDRGTLGAYPAGRHHLAPPCTLRQVNYILGWAGVGYRPSFFTSEFMGDLAWLKTDVVGGRRSSSAWLDDQYISGHLNKEAVPLYLLPFPKDGRWRFISKGSAARSSKNHTHLMMQTAAMLMRFAGTGDEAWNLPVTHRCTTDCAKISKSLVPQHCAAYANM